MKLRLVAAMAAAAMLSACGLNSVPTAEEAAKAKWAEVQNQYQRRADLIPNLVETAKGAAKIEQSTLKPLPVEPYEFAAWKEVRVGLDYHVDIEKHYYSAPHQLLRQELWVRMTARTVEVFHKGKRVASHLRNSSNRKHTTIPEHMPSSHRRYADWTPESLKRRAGEIGPKTSTLVEIVLRSRPHPEQGFRSCMGILRLAKTHGPNRLEAACARALEIGAHSFTSVKSILNNDLDRRRPAAATDGPAIVHANIRGPGYFH